NPQNQRVFRTLRVEDVPLDDEDELEEDALPELWRLLMADEPMEEMLVMGKRLRGIGTKSFSDQKVNKG
ncbi:hypothetical protein, partial [Gluconobacter oxydans]|uniref:hypothetical protein n=1 Tax=Gluconobacter oxydans TaxID=442 RepID=UPI000AB04A2D